MNLYALTEGCLWGVRLIRRKTILTSKWKPFPGQLPTRHRGRPQQWSIITNCHCYHGPGINTTHCLDLSRVRILSPISYAPSGSGFWKDVRKISESSKAFCHHFGNITDMWTKDCQRSAQSVWLLVKGLLAPFYMKALLHISMILFLLLLTWHGKIWWYEICLNQT